MHEMSLATALMDQLLAIAERQDAVRVVQVELRCGVMQQVVPEAMQLAFEAATKDTVADGAELILSEEPLAGACRACGERFAPQIDDFTCPRCGKADVELEAGRDIILQSVVCDTKEKATAP